MNMGLKGFIAGTVVGAFVGSLTGFFFDSIFWITGTSMQSLQETQKKIYELREEYVTSIDNYIFSFINKRCHFLFSAYKD